MFVHSFTHLPDIEPAVRAVYDDDGHLTRFVAKFGPHNEEVHLSLQLGELRALYHALGDALDEHASTPKAARIAG